MRSLSLSAWQQPRESKSFFASLLPQGRKVAGIGLIAAMVALAGCGGDDNERTDVGGDTTEARIVAILTGSVVDTNNAPIEGATVGVAGLTTTTNELGQWRFEDVPVVNVQNNSDTPCAGTGDDSNSGLAGGCTGVPLRVTVTAEGHLGGHTFITPEGQIFSSQNAAVTIGLEGDSAADSAADSGGQTNPQVVFTNGMLVQAEPLALPELGASILVEIDNAVTGQAFAGQDIALEFDQTLIDRTDESAAGINFQTILASGTTADDGTFTFTGLPADSVFGLRATGFSFNDCEADEPPDVVSLCELNGGETTFGEFSSKQVAGDCAAARTASVSLTASQVFTNEGESCLIGSDDVATRVDYVGFGVNSIAPSDDSINPFLASVAGVFNLVSCFECDEGQLHGLLNQGVNQSFTFTYSEGLVPITAADVLVFNNDTNAYVDLAAVDPVVQSGDQVTINLANALPDGTFFSVYLLIPGHRDLADNILLDEPVVTIPDPVDFDTAFGADGICDSEGCPGGAAVEVRLCTFFRPATDPGAPQNALQERFDPRLAGMQNDWPVNQGRSSSFNDVRDQGGDASAGAFDDLIQQFNAPGQTEAGDRLGELAFAFGEDDPVGSIGVVNTDVARVEWDPLADFDNYRITVERSGSTETFITDGNNFVLNSYDSTFVSQLPGTLPLTAETTQVDRAGTLRNAFIYEAAQDGDIITVAAIDDLGNPGATSAPVTIVDNVEPTVVLERSYQDLHNYTVNGENLTEDLGGCVVRAVPTGVVVGTTVDVFIHAGVEAEGGTADAGSGGEVTTGGTADVVGDVCVGVSPELLIAAGDTDPDISTAHNELVAGRSAGLNTLLTDPTFTSSPYAAEIYDDQAWLAWPVAARQVGSGATSNGGMGIAFSENLAAVDAPTFSGTTALSNYTIQNDTAAGQTVNAIVRPDVEDLVRVTVADALALANADAGEVIDFTGATDLAGNPASADAVAHAQIRDQWAPYMVSAFRTIDGDLVFTWNEPVVIDNGDVLSFAANVPPIVTFTFTTIGTPNFTQSNGGLTVTIDAADVPVALGTLLTNSGLVYDDVDSSGDPILAASHVIVDWRTIADQAGNSWQIYVRSFADVTPFFDDVPGFALVDSIGPFGVVITQPGFTAGSSTFTLTYAFSHPIFLDTDDVCGTANTVPPTVTVPAGAGELGFLGTNGTLEVESAATDPDVIATGFMIEPADVVSATATETTISLQIDLSQAPTIEALASGDTIATANVAVSQLICGTMGDTIGPATQLVP